MLPRAMSLDQIGRGFAPTEPEGSGVLAAYPKHGTNVGSTVVNAVNHARKPINFNGRLMSLLVRRLRRNKSV